MTDKKNAEEDIDDLEMDDLDDLEMDDLEFDDVDFDRKPSTTEQVKDLAKESGKGFLSTLARDTSMKALPDSYEYGIPEAMDYADYGKELIGKNKSKIDKSLYGLGKEVKKILPFQVGLLDKYLDKRTGEYEKEREETEEAVREATIGSAVGSIFDKQLEIQKAIESKRSAEDKVDSKERLVSNKLQLDVLRSIAQTTGQHTAFSTQIGKEYYRKSLELQFKTYFIQADMLKTTRDYFSAFSTQFDTIVKNTGLPDFVKLHNKEMISETIKRRAIEGTTRRLFDNNKFVKGAKDRMTKFTDNAVGSVTDKVDQVTEMLGMAGGGGNPLGLFASVLASIGGSTLGEKVANKLSPKIREKIKDNKLINATGENLKTLGSSPQTFATEMLQRAKRKQQSLEDQDSPTGVLGSKLMGGVTGLLDAAVGGGESFKVNQSSNIMNHDQPAIFDQRVHRSLTEVIPMYLAKSLQKTTDLVNMYSTVNKPKLGNYKASGELMYDYSNRKLDTEANVRTSVANEVFSKKAKNAESVTSSITSSTLSELTTKKDKVSKAQSTLISSNSSKESLKEYVTKMSDVKDFDMSYDNLITGALTAKEGTASGDYLKDNPKLRTLLETIDKVNQNDDKKIQLNKSIIDATSIYPVETIKTAIKTISGISGSDIPNNLTNKQATIFAKMIATYISKSGGKVPTSFDIAERRLFNGTISEEDFNVISSVSAVLVSEVIQILNLDDQELNSKLLAAVSLMNEAVKSKMDAPPETFQKLHDFDRRLVAKGTLNSNNLVEGSLDVLKDTTDYVSPETLNRSLKLSGESLNKARASSLASAIDARVGSAKTGISDTYREAKAAMLTGGVRGTMAVIKKKAGQVSDKAKKAYKDQSSKVTKHLKVMESSISKLSESTKGDVLDQFVKQITNSLTQVDAAMNTTKTTLREMTASLDELKSIATDISTRDTDTSNIDRDKENLVKKHDAELKHLGETKVTLENYRSKVLEIRNKDPLPGVTDITKLLRDGLTTMTAKLDSIVVKARVVNESNKAV